MGQGDEGRAQRRDVVQTWGRAVGVGAERHVKRGVERHVERGAERCMGSRGEVGRGDSEGSGAAGWGDATRERPNDQILAIAGMRWLSEAGSMKQTSWVQFPVRAHEAQSSPS